MALAGCERGTVGAADAPPPLLTIDEGGAGGLDASTAFSRDAIAAALPEGFELEESQVVAEGDSVATPVLYAFHEGQIVLEVSPDTSGRRVARIDASSAEVAGPRGLRPGMDFREARADRMRCEPGRGDLSGRAVCALGGGPLRYVFAHGGAPMPGALPDEEVLERSILERIVWVAL